MRSSRLKPKPPRLNRSSRSSAPGARHQGGPRNPTAPRPLDADQEGAHTSSRIELFFLGVITGERKWQSTAADVRADASRLPGASREALSFVGIHMVAARSTADRFHEKYEPITESGCWIWLGAETKGYGTIKHNGATVSAHRVSYLLHRGPIPNGLWVLHRCDTPLCVNPEHLFLGTPLDNERDKISKGRYLHWRDRPDFEVCIRGHDADWHVSADGARHCRACRRETERARKANRLTHKAALAHDSAA
jgi:HNH endonuclease